MWYERFHFVKNTLEHTEQGNICSVWHCTMWFLKKACRIELLLEKLISNISNLRNTLRWSTLEYVKSQSTCPQRTATGRPVWVARCFSNASTRQNLFWQNSQWYTFMSPDLQNEMLRLTLTNINWNWNFRLDPHQSIQNVPSPLFTFTIKFFLFMNSSVMHDVRASVEIVKEKNYYSNISKKSLQSQEYV